MRDERQPRLQTEMERKADACVKCGLCLPRCPTYQITGLEGESPRGRIALVQGLAAGVLSAGGRTAEHLESCTGCLTCETVCPAGVRYGELIDFGRAELRRHGHRGSVSARWLSAIARHQDSPERYFGYSAWPDGLERRSWRDSPGSAGTASLAESSPDYQPHRWNAAVGPER